MSETQAMMGAIARGHRFIDAVGTDDPEHIVTWAEAVGTITQLVGEVRHEQDAHEQTRDLLRLVERSSDAVINKQRDALRELREVLVEHHDIEDGGAPGEHPHQVPNWAMRATSLIDEALSPPPHR